MHIIPENNVISNAKKSYIKPLKDVLDEELGPEELYDHHDPLTGGWSEEQLQPAAELLRPYLPNLTRMQLMAAARVARSMSAHGLQRPGVGCFYSRNKQTFGRYASRDCYGSIHLQTIAIDELAKVGLLTSIPSSPKLRRRSVIYETDKLMQLLSVLHTEEPNTPEIFAPVILRNADGRPIAYDDNDETLDWGDKITHLNSFLAKETVQDADGNPLKDLRLEMKFRQTFDRGGRLYGPWQRMYVGKKKQRKRSYKPSNDRLLLQIDIEGVLRPVVEWDYSAIQPQLAYAQVRAEPPTEIYDIDGYETGDVKRALLIMFCSASRKSAILATSRKTRLARGDTRRLIDALEVKHHAIRSFFYQDSGARLQKIDGQIALDVMLQMVDKTGHCPLGIHDSFIVADIYEDTLREVMNKVATEHGIPDINIKKQQREKEE